MRFSVGAGESAGSVTGSDDFGPVVVIVDARLPILATSLAFLRGLRGRSEVVTVRFRLFVVGSDVAICFCRAFQLLDNGIVASEQMWIADWPSGRRLTRL